jgi:hypothetical protein
MGGSSAGGGESDEKRAERLHELKAHFSLETCLAAVGDIDEISAKAPKVAS